MSVRTTLYETGLSQPAPQYEYKDNFCDLTCEGFDVSRIPAT